MPSNMLLTALKMLMGDRAKYLGIILGLTFASLLITQQAAIFLGLMTRTYGFVVDTAPDSIWVMDPKVQFIDDIKPLQDTQLLRVRGVAGIEYALPLYKGLLKSRLPDGTFQTCIVVGLDDATLMGGPPIMLEGKLEDLRRAEGVIIDESGANDKLARQPVDENGIPIPNAKPVPLKLGDIMELNDRRAVVVGICRVSKTFQSQPVIYTTYQRAMAFAPSERKLLSFILVKQQPGVNVETLRKDIESQTGLAALTADQFEWRTVDYFMRHTGIPLNFSISVALGFIVGTAVAGQTFYNFTLDNLRHFGALKAMGAPNSMLLKMILMQAMLVGVIGYGLGVGLAAMFGYFTRHSELSFLMPWQLLAGSAIAIAVICIASALLSISKVIRLEPAIVFKG